MTQPQVGRAVPRADARRLVAGAGCYVDDISTPGALHVAFVRSTHAHAAILSIDTAAAALMPGVVRVVCATDLEGICKPMQVAMPALQMPTASAHFPLAVDEVCWHGAPVAAIVAHSRAQAEDAAEHVLVEYDELPAVVDAEQAVRPDSPRAVRGRNSNLALDRTFGIDNGAASFAAAATVVEQRIVFDRQTGVPLESRGIIASFSPFSRELAVHMSHQSPFQMREVFSDLLSLPNHKVRVSCPDVGGAFGLKLHAYPEEITVAAIAVLLGRTIRFQADRLESFLSDTHAREAVGVARLALDSAGRFLAIDVEVLSGLGAYQAYPRGSIGEGLHMAQMVGAPYQFDHFRARMRAVHQNKSPTGAYRGVGQPLACTLTETLVDRAARTIGEDPAELRRRNYLSIERSSRTTPAGLEMSAMSLHACLDTLLAMMHYEDLRREQQRLREQRIYRGIGMASFIELTGVGSAVYGANQVAVPAQEGCSIRLEPSGTVLCHSSATDQGQGVRTGVAQIVAQTLGIDAADVTVRAGDTASSPVGGGAWASRGIAIGGQAALLAAEELRGKILELGARILKAPAEQIDIADGALRCAATARTLSFAELANIAYFRQHQLPPGSCPELSATRHYVSQGFPYLTANGMVGCLVETDIETGMIEILRLCVVHDCGRVINPLLVDEQIRGGVVQGIGGVLYEHCEYSESGQLSNGTLADYLVPMAGELPDIEVAHVASAAAQTSLGAKGVGEAGTIGGGAALWNAVNDALAALGAAMEQQPFSPDRVLRALAEGARARNPAAATAAVHIDPVDA
ncbi:MAG TPA: xanthine dehydrogenase family protein molybdopterin-binding subunit [Steroidobacteraceae bacterium]|nr:xanthine dehydrogenase family protein molybdopterin-binding subunit [Steroidobacteraceae bacterium]